MTKIEEKTNTCLHSEASAKRWRKVKLGEVAGVLGGFAFKSEWFNTQKIGFPSVKIQNISDGSVDIKNAEHVDVAKVKRDISKFKLHKGDFLVAMTGATAGKVGLLTEETPCYLNQRVGKFYSKNEDELDKKFLYYSVIKPKNLNLLKKLADGSAQGNMSSSQIEDVLEIFFPDGITDQKRIANILSAFDDKIELNNKISAVLEQMAQAIFKEWFVRSNKLPDGWAVKTFGDLSKNFDSKRAPLSNMERAKRKGNIPYYGAAGIIDYIDKALFDGEYLLIAEDGTVSDDEGRPTLQFIEGRFWVNNHAHIVQGMDGVPTHYLYLFLKMISITPYITGAVQLKLTQENLNSIPILLPGRETLEKYDQIVGPIFQKIRAVSFENQKLAALRDLLLPKLMSGEIRV